VRLLSFAAQAPARWATPKRVLFVDDGKAQRMEFDSILEQRVRAMATMAFPEAIAALAESRSFLV